MKTSDKDTVVNAASGIAHDYNNILGAIVGNLALAKKFAKGNAKIVSALNDAHRSCLRAKELTNRLKNLSRGDKPEKKPVEVPALINDAVEIALTGSGTIAKVNVSKTCRSIAADRVQILQSLINLIINARQAMSGNGTISISARNIRVSDTNNYGLKKGVYVLLRISDTGPGIPDKNLKRIFTPYFTTKEKGHGLGLSIAYDAVKNHGGAITVESNRGKGTTFHIYLPSA